MGGEDLPIAVSTDAAASETRALVQQVVLGGAAYAAGARALAAVKDVNDEVARDPAGIGALGLEFAVVPRGPRRRRQGSWSAPWPSSPPGARRPRPCAG